MKNLNIKAQMFISALAEVCAKEIQAFAGKVNEASNLLKEEAEESRRQNEVIAQFKALIQKCHPDESQTPVIQESFKLLEKIDFKSISELRDEFDKILFQIYFSKGENKVFDLNDEKYYDDVKCQQLFDHKIYIPENWLDQFMRCLKEKNAGEDMILHNLTPGWMWPK